jgi:hypothetical protein
MQTGGESIEYPLVNMVFGKKEEKLRIGEDPKRQILPCLFPWKWAK